MFLESEEGDHFYMLKIIDLKVTTNKGRKLVDSFSFVLKPGDKIALIGEEGNGKSTILKILAGKDVSDYVSYSGTVSCDERIGYLPQRIPEEDLNKDVISYIDEQIDYNHLYSLLSKIDVDADLLSDRILRTLSGGEKVKIAILKILYEDPDILLLDEPSNDLDLKTLLWLEDFIINTRLPLIFVSHDEALLESCANGILHLEQLKRKSEPHMNFAALSYEEYVSSRDVFINRNNKIAAKEKAQFDKQLDKWRKIYQKVEHRQNTISRADPHGGQLLKKKMHAVKAQGRNLEEKKEQLRKPYEPEEAIDVFFDEVDLNPNKVILDLELPLLQIEEKVLGRDIKLKVFGKDKICIIADNGTGKSTLMKKIYELLKDREDIRLGYMPQNYSEMMDMDVTAVDFLWDGVSKDSRSRASTLLGTLKFTAEEMEHSIAHLSEGQKCKLFFAKLIYDHDDVLLLDEPTRNLSALSGPKIREILCAFKGCIIAISHDRKFIDEVADSVYELRESGLRCLDDDL